MRRTRVGGRRKSHKTNQSFCLWLAAGWSKCGEGQEEEEEEEEKEELVGKKQKKKKNKKKKKCGEGQEDP